jgi:hypothetical protein
MLAVQSPFSGSFLHALKRVAIGQREETQDELERRACDRAQAAVLGKQGGCRCRGAILLESSSAAEVVDAAKKAPKVQI